MEISLHERHRKVSVDIIESYPSWFERFISGHSDAGYVIHYDLCPVCEKYRVYFGKWSFTNIDWVAGGAVV